MRAESAGHDARREVHPEVVEVMPEVGIDLAGRTPAELSLEMQLHADWAVTMGCGDACPYVATRVEDWDLDDPAGQAYRRGSRDPRRDRAPGADLIENRDRRDPAPIRTAFRLV